MAHDHEYFMKLALDAAQKASDCEEVPIGAVVINTQTQAILSKGKNETRQRHNPCAHAEILAIEEACRKAGAQRIPECSIYVTLEPCPMCAAAISYARLQSLVFGAADDKSGGVISGPQLYASPVMHYKPEVIGGIMAEECGQILKEFFRKRRIENAGRRIEDNG